jgi:hypothetical protein
VKTLWLKILGCGMACGASAVLAAPSPPLTSPPLNPAPTASPPTSLLAMQWIDQHHASIQDQLQGQAHRINDWFGDRGAHLPRAQIRVLLDNRWNKHDDVDTKLRLRGSLRLPSAEKRLRVVFGDDTLEDEQRAGVPLDPMQPSMPNNPNTNTPAKTVDDVNERALRDNASIALRWLAPIVDGARSGLDVGVRSGTDIYTRAELGKTWPLDDDMQFLADQTLRYGLESKLFARTHLELQHQPEGQPLTSYLLSVIYSEPDQAQGLSYSHRIARQYQFAAKQQFSYGLLASGTLDGHDLNLNTYGPWLSYRQPFVRDWFFVRGDVNFFNDREADRDHYLSLFVRLEAVF